MSHLLTISIHSKASVSCINFFSSFSFIYCFGEQFFTGETPNSSIWGTIDDLDVEEVAPIPIWPGHFPSTSKRIRKRHHQKPIQLRDFFKQDSFQDKGTETSSVGALTQDVDLESINSISRKSVSSWNSDQKARRKNKKRKSDSVQEVLKEFPQTSIHDSIPVDSHPKITEWLKRQSFQDSICTPNTSFIAPDMTAQLDKKSNMSIVSKGDFTSSPNELGSQQFIDQDIPSNTIEFAETEEQPTFEDCRGIVAIPNESKGTPRIDEILWCADAFKQNSEPNETSSIDTPSPQESSVENINRTKRYVERFGKQLPYSGSIRRDMGIGPH